MNMAMFPSKKHSFGCFWSQNGPVSVTEHGLCLGFLRVSQDVESGLGEIRALGREALEIVTEGVVPQQRHLRAASREPNLGQNPLNLTNLRPKSL